MLIEVSVNCATLFHFLRPISERFWRQLQRKILQSERCMYMQKKDGHKRRKASSLLHHQEVFVVRRRDRYELQNNELWSALLFTVF